MSRALFNLATDFIDVGQCCKCGTPTVLTKGKYERATNDHRIDFYCENGHPQIFSGDGEIDRLKKELEWARQGRDAARKRAEKEERRAASYKGHLTRTKNRVKNGVCPCCNRTFINLQRHMKSKHPTYKGKK